MMVDLDTERLDRSLTPGDIALILAPSEKVSDASTAIVEQHVANNGPCIYVSVAKPSTKLEDHFRRQGIDTDEIFYIDCASSLAASDGSVEQDNAVQLHPSELTDLSITMQKAVEGMPHRDDPLLLFDSLSTLMIYNNAEHVSRFSHELSSRTEQWGIKSVILALSQQTDDTVKSQLAQFVDETIHLA